MELIREKMYAILNLINSVLLTCLSLNYLPLLNISSQTTQTGKAFTCCEEDENVREASRCQNCLASYRYLQHMSLSKKPKVFFCCLTIA